MSGKRTRAPSPQSLALHVLERVERDRAFARPVLDAALRRATHLTPAQRALVTRLVRGTLKWRLQLDHHLSALLPRGLERTDERVAWILRLGAFNLLREEGLASSIAVDVAVRLARECGRSGLAGLVNAVLRRLAVRHAEGALALPDPLADPVGHLAVATALPRWLARKWLEELGPVEALQLGLGLNRPPPLTVRVQPPATVEEMRTWLASQGIVSRPASRAPDALVLGSPGSLAELEAASAGRLFVQDEAAILVGHLVAPGPASVVLDACAAPGGKAAHLRGLVGEDGEVHARDTGEGRIRLLQAVASRVDLLVAARDLLDPPRPEDIDRFDAVLLDAPCSNLGTLRRHPEAKARLEEGIVERSAELQRLMIAAAAPLVQPGGLLVFSVCSIAPEEGWGVVDRFLATGAGKAFFPEHPPQEALFAGLLDCRGALQTLPHRDDMDGFFALRLRRETR